MGTPSLMVAALDVVGQAPLERRTVALSRRVIMPTRLNRSQSDLSTLRTDCQLQITFEVLNHPQESRLVFLDKPQRLVTGAAQQPPNLIALMTVIHVKNTKSGFTLMQTTNLTFEVLAFFQCFVSIFSYVILEQQPGFSVCTAY